MTAEYPEATNNLVPVPRPQTVSELSSPVDTLECVVGTLLFYEYRNVRITGDMLLDELDEILDLVEANVFADETITGVKPPGVPGCIRLPFSTSGDVVAQTSRDAGASEEYVWGRFFSFERAGGDLVLLEVGIWEWGEGMVNP